MSIYDDPALPRVAWRPWSRDYAGYDHTPFVDRRRPRPRPVAKRLHSRHPAAGRPSHFLVIGGAFDVAHQLVSERRVPYRVGLRLVNWLRNRGHLAFLY